MKLMDLSAFNCPKPKTLPTGQNLKPNNIIGKDDLRYLLVGQVVVEEKMDGTMVKFASMDPELVIFAEDLKRRRSIFYQLPGRYSIFEIYNVKRGVFLDSEEKISLSNEMRRGKIKIPEIEPVLFFPTPRIATGKFALEELLQFVGESAYARGSEDKHPVPGEGIVVKQFADNFPIDFVTGKIISEGFPSAVIGSYLQLPYMQNVVDPSLPLVIDIPRKQ